jgi:hypothetical protein
MFGMTLGLVASLFLVERAHDARLPALVTIPPNEAPPQTDEVYRLARVV